MKKENNKPRQNKKNNLLMLLIILIIAVVSTCALIYFLKTNKNEDRDVAYTEFLQDIENGLVEKIEMTVGSTSLKVTYKERENDDDTKKVIIPNTQAFIEYVHDKMQNGIGINLEQKKSGFLAGIQSNLLSIISTGLMIVIVVMIFKMQGLRR